MSDLYRDGITIANQGVPTAMTSQATDNNSSPKGRHALSCQWCYTVYKQIRGSESHA